MPVCAYRRGRGPAARTLSGLRGQGAGSRCGAIVRRLSRSGDRRGQFLWKDSSVLGRFLLDARSSADPEKLHCGGLGIFSPRGAGILGNRRDPDSEVWRGGGTLPLCAVSEAGGVEPDRVRLSASALAEGSLVPDVRGGKCQFVRQYAGACGGRRGGALSRRDGNLLGVGRQSEYADDPLPVADLRSGNARSRRMERRV